jgi:hypothetical protein
MKTIDCLGKTFNYEDANGNKSKLIAVLSAMEQAVDALEKLADCHDAADKPLEAHSNSEYIKVLKGQLICHKLVEEQQGR